jgi:hypothetical protein
MSTLLSVHGSEGLIGRCDAKCYDAKEPGCDCVCGGKNHGAGLKQAMVNTELYSAEWIAAIAEKKGDVKADWGWFPFEVFR